ncbi:MAG: hypothetical protein H0U44_09090 [Flavisolibacter sp.]|jgi:hypothetical protein|nr:hypothetical protein [Flavisolibacter sp.]
MKKDLNGAMRSNGNAMFIPTGNLRAITFLCFAVIFLAASCKKEVNVSNAEDKQQMAVESSGNVLNQYTGHSAQTKWELQQARAATARYKNIQNALKDGYIDINVVAENMGYHYMKPSLVDATFDIRNPEILVYNKNHSGKMELVAVEYAVPLTSPRPEGFTGAGDVWDEHTGFSLWLLHAWVWSYNPAGVFNSTNPDVHLH